MLQRHHGLRLAAKTAANRLVPRPLRLKYFDCKLTPRYPLLPPINNPHTASRDFPSHDNSGEAEVRSLPSVLSHAQIRHEAYPAHVFRAVGRDRGMAVWTEGQHLMLIFLHGFGAGRRCKILNI
jgi:hypothetical protein